MIVLKDLDNRIVLLLHNRWIRCATPTLPTDYHYSRWTIPALREVDLLKETWVHPHLPKAIKEHVMNLKKDLA